MVGEHTDRPARGRLTSATASQLVSERWERTPSAGLTRAVDAVIRRKPALTDEQRARLRAAFADEHVRQIVESAPPLSTHQRDRLSILMGSGTRQDFGGTAA